MAEARSQSHPATAGDSGFTLLEVLIAMTLTSLVVVVALWLASTDVVIARAAPEAADVQERARVAMALLESDIASAGGGIAHGPLSGSLARLLPALVPRRMGLTGADPPSIARTDAMTMIVPAEIGWTAETTMPVDGTAPVVTVATGPPCPIGPPFCGIPAGTVVLIVDGTGRHALYVVTDVAGSSANLRALQTSAPAFDAGAIVVPVESRTYYFDRANRLLRRYDEDASDTPVVDDVVDVRFEYLGDPSPPLRPKPPAGQSNCLYDADGHVIASSSLAPQGGSLAPLPLDMFTDGPWCGDGDRQFDVDLMRIRSVRLHVRVQAALDRFRAAGPPGVDFRVPGTGRTTGGLVPDLELTAEIAPRSLNLGR
jgi:prepilin-type N-terminal cleavage/methylation domain-containing protein